MTRTPLSTPDPPIFLPISSVAVFLAILDILVTVGNTVSPSAATPSFAWQFFVEEMRWSRPLVRSRCVMGCPRGAMPRRPTRPGFPTAPDALAANGFGPQSGSSRRGDVSALAQRTGYGQSDGQGGRDQRSGARSGAFARAAAGGRGSRHHRGGFVRGHRHQRVPTGPAGGSRRDRATGREG